MKLLVLVAAASALFAQDRPAFEAASVKVSNTQDLGMSMHGGPGQLEWKNASLRYLIQLAYGLHNYDYSAPAWLDTVRVDIVARIPAGDKVDRYPKMLQTLLAERFKLAAHREVKDVPGLALVVDKKGLRIEPVKAEGPMSSSGPNMVRAKAITMTQFASALGSFLGYPVKDMTALAGVYDINIQWTPDTVTSADPSDLPGSVNAAVQELGLRLQVQKIAVEILVVDHVERTPTEN
jgi:uncharacterized protein (TIGR03435 family)